MMKSSLSCMIKKIFLFLYRINIEFAEKHKSIWKNRIIASYLGRLKTLVLSLCASEHVDLDGKTMYLPKNEYLHLVVLEHGGLDTKIVKQLVKEGDIVLDLGANIGYWTCLFSELVGKNGKVYSFEPSPANFELLKKNVEVNGYKNVILEQRAVAERSYTTKLYLSQGSMDNRIYRPNEPRNSVQIEVVALKDYFANSNTKIDFIKCNIQGADFAAIQGMDDIMEISPNLKIIVEFDPTMSKEYGSEPSKFIDYMLLNNFDFYELLWYNNKLKPIEPKVLKHYEKLNISTNLLCLKKQNSFLEI